MYIIGKPMHTILTILTVPETPLTKESHEAVARLGEISDIIFIFKSPQEKTVDIPKFTNLYEGYGYYVADQETNIGQAVVESLVYGYEVIRKHTSYLVTSVGDLPIVASEKGVRNIETVNASSIFKPVYLAERLGPEELEKIYQKPSPTVVGGSWWKKSREVVAPDTPDKMWARWKAASKAIWLRSQTIGLIRLTEYEDPEFYQYSKTFTFSTPDILLVSYLKKLGVDNINACIEELNVNSLK